MIELKHLPEGCGDAALALAERCRTAGEPEEAESICLDLLAVEPSNQRARVLLVLARSDLLDEGLPGSVQRAREALAGVEDEYQRAYYDAVICERQAKHLLRRRGRRSGFVAYDWFRLAMESYEEAARLAPARPEPVLRWNACARQINRNPHCVAAPDEVGEHGIE